MITYPDPAKQLCLLTDASDTGWGLVVTQVPKWTREAPVQEQQHELLICMGGSFTGSALNWSVIEKESYPIIHACDKLEYLQLRPQGFKLYCDHRNIIHLFAPSKELKKHVRGKLLWRSTKLLEYRYTLEHIEGAHNVWADLISRWGGHVEHRAHMSSAKRFTRVKRKRGKYDEDDGQDEKRQRIAPMAPRPLDDDDFIWPTLNEIRKAQAKHKAPAALVMDEDSVGWFEGRIWIPGDERQLLQRLLIIVHCGSGGHRGMHVMKTHLRRLLAISGLTEEVRSFCRQCLLCLPVKGGKIIPRPFSETHHTFERNETMHWDFLTLGDSFGTSRYVLVLMDEATHYVELVACDSPTAEVVAAAMLNWYSRFGIASVWVSDSGSHFKNKVIADLNRRLKTRQQFILAYTPWKNGTVERVNRDIVQVLRALTMEFRVSKNDWPHLLPLVQSSLNHSPVGSLANRAPIELFTGLPCPSALDTVIFPGRKGQVASLPDDRPDIERRLAQLRASIQAMHQAVQQRRTDQALRYRNRYHHEQPVNFSVGDYVLRSRVDEKLYCNKLLVTWVGPYRVVSSAEYYFTVEHLVTGKCLKVHPSRLKLYADNALNVTTELLEHVASQGTMLAVEALSGHRFNTEMKAYEIQVKWQGLEDIEDSWEPLATIKEDVPLLLAKYVDEAADDSFRHAIDQPDRRNKKRGTNRS
jgi:transposase InsO family protein